MYNQSMETKLALGRKIEKLRKAKGLNKKELAGAIGITPSYMGHIEAGKRTPSRDVLINLANVLDASINELLLAAGYPILPSEEGENQFDGYRDLSPAKRKLAKRMIEDIIRNLKESD
jgi:transcriptional regulator with XRE-family HTH domain